MEKFGKNAFVRFELLMIWYSIPLSTKTIDPTAVSANPTKDFGKKTRSRRNEQSIPPIMKNVRYNAQQNLLKRERYRAEHKAPKQKNEVAISDLHRNSANNIVPNPRQPSFPAAAIPRGEELESRG